MDINFVREQLARRGLVNNGENLDTSNREIWIKESNDAVGDNYVSHFVVISRKGTGSYYITVKRIEKEYAEDELDFMNIMEEFFYFK